MPIRTAVRVASPGPAPVSGAPLDFLSDRAWPGLRPWLLSVICSIGIFALLSGLAWHGPNGRLPDMAALLIAIPASALTLSLLAAALWTLLARVPFTSGLAFVARILPLTWAIPLLDLIRSGGRGVILSATPLDAPSKFLAAVTGALLPAESAVPLAIRLGIFSIVIVTAFVVWFARKPVGGASTFIRSFIAALVMSLATVKLTFFSSELGIWNAFLHGRGWVTGTVETGREAIRAVTNGYWWTNLYDRFPAAVEPQADIAIRLTAVGVAALALGVMLTLILIWRLSSWKRLLAHVFRARSALDLVGITIGAAIITALAARVPPPAGTWWIALPLALLALAAFRLHAVLERCLHRAGSDSFVAANPADGPIACGDLAPSQAADLSLIALAFSLLAALALGWPIFATLLASLAASWLSRDRLWSSWPWAATVFRAAGAASLALAGFFFMSQSARMTGVAALVMTLAAAYRVGSELLFKAKRPL